MSEQLKLKVAQAVIPYLKGHDIIGIGTGTTVNYLINELKNIKDEFKAAVASSVQTKNLLEEAGIQVLELNEVDELTIYIDSADCCNDICQLTKGRGGALTREKVLANFAEKFICIIDDSKIQGALGSVPVPIEVIPMSKTYVAQQIVKMKGMPKFRDGFITDNGNEILDVYNWTVSNPLEMEEKLNNIPGVVENGIFAKRSADIVLIASDSSVEEKTCP